MLINSPSSSCSSSCSSPSVSHKIIVGNSSKLNNTSSPPISTACNQFVPLTNNNKPINSVMTTTSSYSNIKQTSPSLNTCNNNYSTITRQSSTLTLSNNNSTHHQPSNKSTFGGKIPHNNSHQTPAYLNHNHQLSCGEENTTRNNNSTINSQNNPKSLNRNIDYKTQSTTNLTNGVVTSKSGNFQTLPLSIVPNTTFSDQTSSVQINDTRQSRSTSNGGDNDDDLLPTKLQTNQSANTTMKSSRLRGMAMSTTSLTSLATQKLPPLSLHRSEKSTSDSSLENLGMMEEPATPRFVNIDKYFKLAQIIMDEEACEVFLEFLRRKRNEENLEFILQVSALKKIPSLNNVAAIEILQRIRSDFLTIGSMYELNVNKQAKMLSIDRIDRCLQQVSTSQSSLNSRTSSPISSLHSSSPSTISSLTYSAVQSADYSFDSPSLISSSFSSGSTLHSSPRDHSESSSSTCTEMTTQPMSTSSILKEIELEVRLQLQNESFKEFKASDEFEHFLLTKVIEQSQNNNPVNSQSPYNSPHQTESVNPSRLVDKSSPSVGSPQTGGFFSKIFKKKSTTTTQETKSEESTTDDEMSVGSGDSDYVYNPQNPSDFSFVENLQMRKWNNQQVINFFKFKLDLPEYSDSLKKNDIKGVDLSLLKKEDTPDLAADKVDTSELQKKVDAFFKKIKMVKLGHKKKLQREVNESILAYHKKQQKSNVISSLERPRKVSDSILPKSHISMAMEADLATIIIKLWILPLDQKRVFTVKRCIKLDRLKSIILKEIGDLIEKKYPSGNPNQLINTRVVKTSKGESLPTNEKLYQYLCTESTNSQFVTLKIEI